MLQELSIGCDGPVEKIVLSCMSVHVGSHAQSNIISIVLWEWIIKFQNVVFRFALYCAIYILRVNGKFY
jgi:hypothetical protein